MKPTDHPSRINFLTLAAPMPVAPPVMKIVLIYYVADMVVASINFCKYNISGAIIKEFQETFL